MGIINATPDSFSSDGVFLCVDTALKHAENFVKYGAKIIDVGGESTRPQATYVDEKEEIDRVVPIIDAISQRFPHIDISIDTYKSKVAEAALDAGANCINDVWAGQQDPSILHLAKDRDVPICLMHNATTKKHVQKKEKIGSSYKAPNYNDFMGQIVKDLQELGQNALNIGIKSKNIILDPGIGFGKTVEQNMLLINHLPDIKALGFTVSLGASRKSFMGHVLNTAPKERLEATLAVTALAIIRGVDIIRVHDVKENVRVATMMEAMLNCTQQQANKRSLYA